MHNKPGAVQVSTGQDYRLWSYLPLNIFKIPPQIYDGDIMHVLYTYEFKMDSLNSNREKSGNINFLDIQALRLGLYSTFLGLYLGL